MCRQQECRPGRRELHSLYLAVPTFVSLRIKAGLPTKQTTVHDEFQRTIESKAAMAFVRSEPTLQVGIGLSRGCACEVREMRMLSACKIATIKLLTDCARPAGAAVFIRAGDWPARALYRKQWAPGGSIYALPAVR